MELYVDTIATTSRAVLAFCRHEGVDVTVRTVSLMKGENHQPAFSALNPNRMVPVLVDGGFVLTESSAMLRYLARQRGSALYPADLRTAARVDEAIAWFESNFSRDFGHQYVYPQFLPHFKRSSDEATRATIAWGRDQSRRWLAVLDSHFLGAGKRYLAGDHLTIADFFGGSIISLGELVGCRFDGYPNVQRWYATLNALESWRCVNADFRHFAQALQANRFVPLQAEHAEAA